ncbi:MAG: HAD-IA family hydrolase [Candidatus Brocadiia bacterium]
MAKLTGIFFDLDDTLYSCTEFAQKARRNAVRAMVAAGLSYPEEQLYRELEAVIDEFTSNYEKHFDNLLLRLPRESFREPNSALIVAAGVTAYHNTKAREMYPYEDALEFLARARKTKLIRGIITAGITIKQAEKIVRLGILPFLTPGSVFITEQVGMTKRNNRLFLTACERFGLDPTCTMYVGDNPAVDVDVPSEIGMITVLHRRSGKYSNVPATTQPRYVIDNYYDLMEILARDFSVPILQEER